jgi:hypothetical protein
VRHGVSWRRCGQADDPALDPAVEGGKDRELSAAEKLAKAEKVGRQEEG